MAFLPLRYIDSLHWYVGVPRWEGAGMGQAEVGVGDFRTTGGDREHCSGHSSNENFADAAVFNPDRFIGTSPDTTRGFRSEAAYTVVSAPPSRTWRCM